MQFNSGYNSVADAYTPMDRSFYGDSDDTIPPSQSADPGTSATGDFGINDVGMSVPMGISAQNVQGLYSKIRSGVSKMEIGFPGAISGNRQAQTPEMYGKDQRQAIRELGMVNNVEFTTHAAYQIMGMTGAVEQGSDLYKFDMNRARMGQQEVERAIDFAADVAGGGSVVVHTGEFERPLTDMYLPGSDKSLSAADDGRTMFKRRLTEDKDAKFYLIDDRTGQAMSTVEKDRLVAFPEWLRAESDRKGYDNEGNPCRIRKGDYLDYEGRKVIDPFDPVKGRVPQFDEERREFKVKYMSFDDFRQESEEKNKFMQQRLGRQLDDYEKTTQTEAFLQATLETNEGHSRGWSGQYSAGVRDEINMLEKLEKARDFYYKLDQTMPEEDKWKLAVEHTPGLRDPALQRLIPPDTENPLKIINEQINDYRSRINFARQASASQMQQAQDTAETKQHIVDPIKYVDRYAIRHYSEAALHAMERSKDPDNPVVITMENIFPDRFGGHPQELKWLIKRARDKFVDYLTEEKMELGQSQAGESAFDKTPDGRLELKKTKNRWYKPGISKKEAEKLAEKHIKATIDTGHLNMWRKYFQPKQGADPEQNEKEFRKWWDEQITDLAKDKIIGNMHLTDNYGYQDDHLAPGQGNAPVKETLETLKKFGYDKALTVEPGADASTDLSDFHGLMKTWRYMGSSIYGMGAPASGRQTWGQVQNSYFGQNQPPYFVFGAYAPSNDWTLWSQVPME